jgi:hypothetical protein
VCQNFSCYAVIIIMFCEGGCGEEIKEVPVRGSLAAGVGGFFTAFFTAAPLAFLRFFAVALALGAFF